eukprot:25744-Hanusia_phi.AAC.1
MHPDSAAAGAAVRGHGASARLGAGRGCRKPGQSPAAAPPGRSELAGTRRPHRAAGPGARRAPPRRRCQVPLLGWGGANG